MFETDYNKVHAKMFGDLGAKVAGLGIEKGLNVVTPDSSLAQNAIQVAASSGQTSFKTNLENALAAQATLTSDAIMSLANNINENVNYGAECLEKVRRVNPRARNPKVSEKELEVMAKEMINADIDIKRREWADTWFFYGHNPGTTRGLAENIERELWGLWILNEKLKTGAHYIGSTDNPLLAAKIPIVVGTTFGDPGVPELVLRRLADFGIVEARTQLQKLKLIAAQIAKEQLVAERRRKEDDEAAAAYRKALEDAEGADDPARERAYVERQQYEANKKLQERRAKEEKPEPPPITVGSEVDTQAEIDALESWAKTHPPTLSSGNMMHSKREIGSIRDIYGK